MGFPLRKALSASQVAHAVPVAGVTLKSGNLLSCMDVQGPSLALVDSNNIPAEPSLLAEFEGRFFRTISLVASLGLTSKPVVHSSSRYGSLLRDERASNVTR